MDVRVFSVVVTLITWAILLFALYIVVKKAIKAAIRELREEDREKEDDQDGTV